MNVVAQTAPNIIRMDHVYISALGTAENVEDLLGVNSKDTKTSLLNQHGRV